MFLEAYLEAKFSIGRIKLYHAIILQSFLMQASKTYREAIDHMVTIERLQKCLVAIEEDIRSQCEQVEN